MKAFMVACLAIWVISTDAFAAEPVNVIVEMTGGCSAGACECLGVWLPLGGDVYHFANGETSGCLKNAVPPNQELNNIKLIWMTGRRYKEGGHSSVCGSTSEPVFCTESASLADGASGTVCESPAPSSLTYRVERTTCNNAPAWKIIFNGWYAP